MLYAGARGAYGTTKVWNKIETPARTAIYFASMLRKTFGATVCSRRHQQKCRSAKASSLIYCPQTLVTLS